MDMDKLKTNIKRFFSNPNTLTFILVIVLIIIIYAVYSYMVNKATSPVRIPYCTDTIRSMNEIKEEYIGTVQLSGNFVSANGSGLIQNSRNIKGKYVAPGYMIPSNSFFYTEAVADSAVAEKTKFSDLPNDYTIYQLDVDFHSTYGNSIMTGNYIDLYFKAVNKENDNKIIFAQFIKSIQVLAVTDKDGADVFTESKDEEPKPKSLWFAVPTQFFELLKSAEKIEGYNIKIIPVPRNAGYSENPEDTTIASQEVKDFILDKTSTKQ